MRRRRRKVRGWRRMRRGKRVVIAVSGMVHRAVRRRRRIMVRTTTRR